MAKTKILNVRLTEEMYDKLNKICAENKIKKSEFIEKLFGELANKKTELISKSDENQNSITYGLRLTEEEAKSFNNYASKVGETRSRLLRKMVRELINNGVPDLLKNEESTIRFVIRQLSGISRNLNQITSSIHKNDSNAKRINSEYLESIKDHVNSVKNEFVKYLSITRKRIVLDNNGN
ncbi:MAG: hypothetical protein LEGION0398_MBIBDBAK_01084 [Legionellaceae bacterium]